MTLAYFDDEEHHDNQSASIITQGATKIFALMLFVIAFAFTLMFASFSIDDPSPFNVTTNKPVNALGYFGAYVAGPLMQLVGRACWVIPLVLFIWSVRLFLGYSGRNIFNRMIFIPVVTMIAAGFASSWSLSPSWQIKDSGMGGIFGDMSLSAMINFLPFSPSISLLLCTFFLAVLSFFAVAFAAGFGRADIFLFASKVIRDVKASALIAFAIPAELISNMINDETRKTRAGAKREEEYAYRYESASDENWGAPSGELNSGTLNIGDVFGADGHRGSNENIAMEAPMPGDMPMRSDMEASIPLVNRAVNRPVNRVERITAERPKAKLGGLFGKIAQKVNLQKEASDKGDWVEKESPDFEGSNMHSRVEEIVSRKLSKHQELLKRRAEEGPFKDDPLEGADDASMPESLGFPELPELNEPSVDAGALAPMADVNPSEPLIREPKTKRASLSQKAKAEAEPSFMFDPNDQLQFEMPPLSLLQSPETITRYIPPKDALEASARQLEAVLEDYGVKGDIVAVRPGPVVTMYELEPAAGLKASRVVGLADDIARSMSALTARVATIPGRSVIGIELPNEKREMVLLREIFAAKNYGDSKFPLPLALGKDIAGEPIVANLAKMPHLLIAGTTGSGKSVAINTMILSLLYHASPEEVRMIMIDPKMLELSVYDDIPHLLSPVVTDPKKAVVALKWVVAEMEERYRKMSKMGVRNIDGYNGRVADALAKGEGFKRTVQTGFDDATGEPIFETEEYAPEKMPYIVVIVDEMADLMMVAGKEIEACIQRLAQMARASGIHLIMATQRPSVDVITGTVKANFPTRISFQVTSKIDSRTILGEMGAEQLLGQGDMLYMSGGGRVTRVHGPFVSDEEVEEVVRHLKAQGQPEYVSGVVDGPEDEQAANIDAVLGLGSGEGEDVLYDQAVAIVARDRKCSTSYIQRKLSIGYNKAAGLVERMEEEGVVSQANHVGKREILVGEI